MENIMEYVFIGVAALMFIGLVLISTIINEVAENIGKPYTNKDFIDHLAEDLHSEFGIKIYNE